MAQESNQLHHPPLHPTLGAARGKAYWRSLEELGATEEFRQVVEREFPKAASEWNDPVSRRNFLTLMGASLALAGMTGCSSQPDEEIVPYVLPPEQVIPGKPVYYATALPLGGYLRGALVETHMARPTKIEGNPDHPASLGAADVFMQAAILSLYDPDRAQVVTQAGQISTWAQFIGVLNSEMQRHRASGGAGVRILTETITSPTLAAQLRALLAQLPQAKWHQYEPINHDNARAAQRQLFGRFVNTVYRFDQARRVLSLDSNFLVGDPGSLRYARKFIDNRRIRKVARETTQARSEHIADASRMNRLYVVESTPTITGAMADHRLNMPASRVQELALAIYEQLTAGRTDRQPAHAAWIHALVADLVEHRGASIIIAGEHQPPAVHALAAALNEALGNVGSTVLYIESPEANPVHQLDSLHELVNDMNAGDVDTLIVLGANIAYNTPGDLNLWKGVTDPKELADNPLNKVRLRISQSLYHDETAFLSHWHIPEAHPLESWGDGRAYDGTVTILQPIIAPLYSGLSAVELLAAVLGREGHSAYETIRAHWREQAGDTNFETFWQTSLHDGLVANSALPATTVNFPADFITTLTALTTQQPAASIGGMEIIFRPDPCVWDGRFANNGWLQELPKPLTKLTWDNAALLSRKTVSDLGVEDQQLVRLRFSGQGEGILAPVWIQPGHPDNCVTVHLGYGRPRAGRVGTRTATSGGFNAYALQRSESTGFAQGIEIIPTSQRYPMACTQLHQNIDGTDLEGRDILRVHSIGQFVREIDRKPETIHLSLYPEEPLLQGPHQWGMSIDMTACIGCNACVVACQSENNIPVVGKTEVIRQREMHWLRIDTYYSGEPETPDGPYFQPMLCQHCEKAPCEVVCPVEATSHSAEGLNEMTYNRCIGTRYCSNNCPYKVRRFNFFQYSDMDSPAMQLMYNPDVTVRKRGIMEKCTYCVQRLNSTRIEIKKLEVASLDATESQTAEMVRRRDALMRDLQTACQQSCPTEAIIFGDLNYRFSDGDRPDVVKLKAEPHDYGLLAELNTQPRTSYLARVFNPNAALLPAPGGSPEVRPEHEKARG